MEAGIWWWLLDRGSYRMDAAARSCSYYKLIEAARWREVAMVWRRQQSPGGEETH